MTKVRSPIPGVVYPPDADLQHYISQGALTNETLVDVLRQVFSMHADRIAISEAETLITYKQLDEITDRIALGFLDLGLAPNDPVIFQLSNSKELVFCFIACLKAGLIPICTLAAHRKQEIGYLGRHAKAKAHIVDGDDARFDFLQFAREMRTEIPSLRSTIVVRGNNVDVRQGEYALDGLISKGDIEHAKSRIQSIDRDPFQVAMYQLSGGTSGVPKIIPRFHNEYVYTIRTVIEWHKLDQNVVTYTPNPMMHNAPMACFWAPALLVGGEVAILRSLDINAIANMMLARKPNWLIIAPPILWRMKEQGLLSEHAFDHVKGFTITNNAAKLRALTGAPVYPIFGMTEGLLCWCREEDAELAIDTTVGRPISPYDVVKIVKPGTEEEVLPGEVGELVVKGPCTLHGYFDAAERNKEAFTSDGFYRSGDLLATQQIEGKSYLKFWGRVKDVIDRGGEKINAEEVELAAASHPKIGAIAIVPVPDPQYGERACACIISTPGTEPITVTELGQHLEKIGLAKFKWPERIEIFTQFPLTASSKLSKPMLKEMIAKKSADESHGS